ncbi:secondary thiamine-phosphate synthase enzyme YjbQ [Sporomusa sphaeroides]|uniref:secondary thiamine-phosphate synthase enzyme YjbQ n=1 Tax=Sporomusa sphaeroides TaxID=47679 RepID=UPI00202E2609|nr:secondary thiamine-phosphate synthase enzyme YjbQ [Sporomusa sphaeroides]MCM0760772.1 secondary thiamine-phosphate synthase enzyme YjbQ [Sporomusa sphaeroides DSM 2875]HML32252.1 secondary thiamine-phosphate synthase enzyme YjbQ [Sporomusa sphaeroides]
MEQFFLETPAEGFITITAQVRECVRRSRVRQGICQVFVPHTTAGVTINENADPDVVEDMLAALDRMVPELPYKHGEGNSPAHVKSSLIGCSVTVPVVDNDLYLGTWQGIYFCEFDGPRRRKVAIQVVGG